MLPQNFLNELWAKVVDWVSGALVALLLALSLVAFIAHFICWVFLVVEDLVVGVEVLSAIGWLVSLLVLLLSGLPLLLLFVLLWLCLWLYFLTQLPLPFLIFIMILLLI